MSDAPATIMCGIRTCGSLTTLAGMLAPCCPMNEMNTCGATFMGGACLTTTSGTVDPSCPAGAAVGISLPGCCRPQGTCGLNLSIAMLGCIDPTALGGPPGQACPGDGGVPRMDSGDTGTGMDTGTGTDTGTSETGSDTGTDSGRGDVTSTDAPTG